MAQHLLRGKFDVSTPLECKELVKRWVLLGLAATSAYGDLLAVDEENCLFSIDSSKKWTPLPFSPCMKINGSLSCFRHEKIGDMVYWCEESGVRFRVWHGHVWL